MRRIVYGVHELAAIALSVVLFVRAAKVESWRTVMPRSSRKQRWSDLLAQFQSVVEGDEVSGRWRRTAVGQPVSAIDGGLDALSRVPDERPVVAGGELVRVDVDGVGRKAPVAGRSQAHGGVVVGPRAEAQRRHPRVGAKLVSRGHRRDERLHETNYSVRLDHGRCQAARQDTARRRSKRRRVDSPHKRKRT